MTISGKPWTTRRLRVAYCIALLPLLIACAAVTVVFLLVGESTALPLGFATLAGSVALAWLLMTAPKKFPREVRSVHRYLSRARRQGH
jgi:hypothetical protein